MSGGQLSGLILQCCLLGFCYEHCPGCWIRCWIWWQSWTIHDIRGLISLIFLSCQVTNQQGIYFFVPDPGFWVLEMPKIHPLQSDLPGWQSYWFVLCVLSLVSSDFFFSDMTKDKKSKVFFKSKIMHAVCHCTWVQLSNVTVVLLIICWLHV